MSDQVERELRKRIDRLERELAGARRAVVDHPSAHTLRWLAPFIRDAIAAGTWKPGLGVDSVEHELAAALSWLDRIEATAT